MPTTSPSCFSTCPPATRITHDKYIPSKKQQGYAGMNNIIYIVGLVVIVLAILGFLGLR
jgi:hypothetical protein